MASTVTAPAVIDTDRRAFTVTVSHLDTDSFTRSVDRAAMRAAHNVIRSLPAPRAGEVWSLVSGEYAPARACHGRTCESFIRFEVRS